MIKYFVSVFLFSVFLFSGILSAQTVQTYIGPSYCSTGMICIYPSESIPWDSVEPVGSEPYCPRSDYTLQWVVVPKDSFILASFVGPVENIRYKFKPVCVKHFWLDTSGSVIDFTTPISTPAITTIPYSVPFTLGTTIK